MSKFQAVFLPNYTEEVPLYRSLGNEATTTFIKKNNKKIDFALVFQDKDREGKDS